MIRTTAAAGILTGVALFTAGQAAAADAYTNGLFNSTPGYSTITGPAGEKCGTGCTQIKPQNSASVESYEAAQITWLEAHQGEHNTLWTYSESSQAVIAAANDRPELFTNTTVIALAPPKQGSIGYEQVKAPSTVKMTQAIVKGDSVADETGSSFDTHLNGYRNLDMRTAPISSSKLEGTETTRSYYQRPARTSLFSNLFKPASSSTTTAAPRKALMQRITERAAVRKAGRTSTTSTSSDAGE